MGWNKFFIFVVDTRQSAADVVTTYNLFVFRERRSEMERTFDKDTTHQVCAHHQVLDKLSFFFEMFVVLISQVPGKFLMYQERGTKADWSDFGEKKEKRDVKHVI